MFDLRYLRFALGPRAEFPKFNVEDVLSIVLKVLSFSETLRFDLRSQSIPRGKSSDPINSTYEAA